MQRLRYAVTFAAATAATIAVAVAPADGATGTWTKITSPKGPGAALYQFFTTNSPTMNVTGSVSSDVTSVNIYCFTDDDHTVIGPLNSSAFTVSSTHTFAGLASAPGAVAPCTLRAVPGTYSPTTPNSTYVAPFTGPVVYNGQIQVLPGPAYALSVTGSRGAMTIITPDGAGLESQSPVDTYHETVGASPFYFGHALMPANVVSSGQKATRSSVVVDGLSAYLPLTTKAYASSPSGVPTEKMTGTRSATTGAVTAVEMLPLRTCGTTYPQSTGNCAPVNPGVTLKRTITTSAAGAVLCIRDDFVSTDHHTHTVSVEYSTVLWQGASGRFGIRLPGGSWRSPPSNTTITTLPAGPRTILATTDLDATDGASDRTDGGITYSGKPIVYFNDSDVMAMRYKRTVRDGRPARMTVGFEVARNLTSLAGLAGSEQKALAPHLTLTAPAKTSGDNTPTVKGRITNATNGLPTQVTITVGTTSKHVTIGTDGRFAATFSVANGKHVAAARLTDPSGLVLTARRTFTVT